MTSTVLIVGVVLALAVGLFVFRSIPGIRAYFDCRGNRLIVCPESRTSELVEVSAGEAAVGAFLTEPTLRLRECWPKRQDCGQDCLQTDRDRSRKLSGVEYRFQVVPGKEWRVLPQADRPASSPGSCGCVAGRDQVTVEWKQIRLQQLLEVLVTHQPVCWNCHFTESFRRLHPELVVAGNVMRSAWPDTATES